ncbi:MAG TPA: hypothetical protein VJM10_00240 [Candidatus Methylomirabilis sp.]|nr:hypothetical protein [Candidatus Methylomirabilis sp.]
MCHHWATMLSGWESGSPVSLAVRLSVGQDISDGRDNYRRGDYIFEILAAAED